MCVCVVHSGVGTIAVLYCVILVTAKYFTDIDYSKRGPIRHK